MVKYNTTLFFILVNLVKEMFSILKMSIYKDCFNLVTIEKQLSDTTSKKTYLLQTISNATFAYR